jgi:hypothetical protein
LREGPEAGEERTSAIASSMIPPCLRNSSEVRENGVDTMGARTLGWRKQWSLSGGGSFRSGFCVSQIRSGLVCQSCVGKLRHGDPLEYENNACFSPCAP